MPQHPEAAIGLFAFTCGEVTIKKKAAIDDGEGMITMPIPAYLFRHPQGCLLFDTGVHGDLIDPDSPRLGALGKYSRVTVREEQLVQSHLARLGLRPEDITHVVNSHLHYDHCGANHLFAGAKIIVSRAEWAAAHDPELLARAGYNPVDYDIGADVQQIEGECDLFGDGSFVIFPTPGHTPGHQSARVTIGDRRIILVADVCYLKENFDRKSVSRLSFNREDALRSLLDLHGLQAEGWQVTIAHDAEDWARVPQSPEPIATA